MDHESTFKPEVQAFVPKNKKRKEVTTNFIEKDGYMGKMLLYLTQKLVTFIIGLAGK